MLVFKLCMSSVNPNQPLIRGPRKKPIRKAPFLPFHQPPGNETFCRKDRKHQNHLVQICTIGFRIKVCLLSSKHRTNYTWSATWDSEKRKRQMLERSINLIPHLSLWDELLALLSSWKPYSIYSRFVLWVIVLLSYGFMNSTTFHHVFLYDNLRLY